MKLSFVPLVALATLSSVSSVLAAPTSSKIIPVHGNMNCTGELCTVPCGRSNSTLCKVALVQNSTPYSNTTTQSNTTVSAVCVGKNGTNCDPEEKDVYINQYNIIGNGGDGGDGGKSTFSGGSGGDGGDGGNTVVGGSIGGLGDLSGLVDLANALMGNSASSGSTTANINSNSANTSSGNTSTGSTTSNTITDSSSSSKVSVDLTSLFNFLSLLLQSK